MAHVIQRRYLRFSGVRYHRNGVRYESEWVSGLNRNRCPISIGIRKAQGKVRGAWCLGLVADARWGDLRGDAATTTRATKKATKFGVAWIGAADTSSHTSSYTLSALPVRRLKHGTASPSMPPQT
jgi:hypothetical protein